jgi:hypothetical protein
MTLRINANYCVTAQGANEGTFVVAIAAFDGKAMLSKIIVPVTVAVPALALHTPQ